MEKQKMDVEGPITQKRSLGALRKNTKTKPRSPDLAGQLILQRHTIEAIAKQFEETNGEEVVCCLAGWTNHDANGPYLTIEISPKYVRREHRPTQRNNLSFIFNDEENA
jgi:hypothetical protein